MGRPSRLTPRALLGAAILAAGLPVPATGAGALTATGVSVAPHAAYDQVVVTFSGGLLTGGERQIIAPDPAPGDGRATVRVTARGIAARTKPVRRSRVAVRVVRRQGSLLMRLSTPAGRSKFVSYGVDGSRTKLVIRLWRATTSPAARILDDGCLRMTRWTGRAGPRAAGLELTPLFEHGLVVSLRRAGAGGATLAERPIVASEGTFRPDFSGYSRPGRWSGRLVAPSVAPTTPVMLEAWASSAKDGSLECLVQTPVLVRP